MKWSMFRFGPAIAIMIIIIGSCAKVASPTGGAKDTEPPKIVKSNPLNGTINYKGKSFVITFNEYFTLDKINEKFMVSPPMNIKPQISVRGKSLIVEFQEELRENTTYTFYFQDAVKDLNEGNPLNNFQFVFSTGKIIDSLSVTGNVLNSYTLEPEKDILVLMYRNQADSAPRKTLPDYISQADINGGFRINNIQEGKYRLYALQDNNNDKKYDLTDEAFAFSDSLAEIVSDNNYLAEKIAPDTIKRKANEPVVIPLIDGEYKLFLFTVPKKTHYLTSSGRKLPYQLLYTLSLPSDTSKFEFSIPDSGEKGYFIEKNAAGDSMMVWLLDSSLYSRQIISTTIRYPFTDSTGTLIYKKETVSLRNPVIPNPRAKAVKSPFRFSTNLQAGSLKPGQQLIISSQTPFRQPDTSHIKLYESETSTKKIIPYKLIKDSLNSRRYYLNAKLKEGGKYLLINEKAAFGNIYGDVSDSTGISFVVRTANSFGRLTMIIQNGEGDLIVQLLDDRENLVAERKIKNEGPVVFPMLEKGKYKVRVIYDLNGDGKWTTGDFDLKRQPEPVSYFPKDIDLKIDFYLDEDWDVGIRNFKNKIIQPAAEPGKL